MIAYALRSEFAGTVVQYESQEDKDAGNGSEVPAYTGGIITAGDRDVDVRELLDSKPYDGVILVDDSDTGLVTALDEVPVLKRVGLETAGVDPAELELTVGPYDGLLKADLVDRARARGLDGASSATKPAIVAALVELDRREAAAADGSEADRLRLSEARDKNVNELVELAGVHTDTEGGEE